MIVLIREDLPNLLVGASESTLGPTSDILFDEFIFVKVSFFMSKFLRYHTLAAQILKRTKLVVSENPLYNVRFITAM